MVSFSLLQLFFLPADALDFREPFSGSMTISTCTPNGHHHSCSSGVVRSGTPWITTASEIERGGREEGNVVYS